VRCTSAIKMAACDLRVCYSVPGIAENPAASQLDTLNHLPRTCVVFGHRGKYCGIQQGLYSANEINLHQMGQRLAPSVRRWITTTLVRLHRLLHCP
jgi:hypothetical protein